MNETITEKNYPVESLWILKSILTWLIILVIFGAFFLFGANDARNISNLVIYIFFAIFSVVYAALRRNTFRYSIDAKFLNLQQGILNKQQRHIPYGVIQNIFVKQDLLDRLFGLASLTLENASMGAGSGQERQSKVFGITFSNKRQQRAEMIGFSGNKISIPGLSKRNAETLKGIVLQRMKENPIDDSQSGL
jgi:membrane protein YdbS with pleckstrin-like domain